jgi:phosphoribosyl 1,2-cyclic phosphate phosphodiesterase
MPGPARSGAPVKLTFLGTGTSFGVPQLGCSCAVCRSSDPHDKRTRVGALVESNTGTHVLIDTPPELRLQLLAAGVDHIDAVLYTHDHADHTHGIDDLRAFTNRQRSPLRLYGPAETLDALTERFRYIFDDAVRPLPGTSKPEATAIPVKPGQTFMVGDLAITPVVVPHGSATVFAYRIGALAYVTDAKSIPEAAVETLRGARVLVINALFRTGHPTHLSIPEAVSAAREIGAERTYLTHLTHNISHASLAAELPPDIAPAYDGLTIDLD